MDVLICVILALLFVTNIITLFCVKRALEAILDGKNDHISNEQPTVTDPFTKPREVYQSTKSIIVPKTPQQIRNENFEKIRNGEEYGRILH